MRGSRYRRCPACEASNEATATHCWQCTADMVELDQAEAAAEDAPAEASPVQEWRTDLGSLLKDGFVLYFGTLPQLVALTLICLVGGAAITLVVGLLASFLGPLFGLAVLAVGGPGSAILIGFALASHMLLLADVCKDRHPKLSETLAAGLARGVPLGVSLMLFVVFFVGVLIACAIVNSDLPFLGLLLLMLGVWWLAFPLVPVMALENKSLTEAVSRAETLTRGARGRLLVLVAVQGGLLLAVLHLMGNVYRGADAAGDIASGAALLAVGMLAVAILGGFAGVISFVYYWKTTHGRAMTFMD